MFLQVRQGFIYDEDQKAVTKSIRHRIAQVMLNRRSIKREISGEEKKEKEKLDSEEQAVKPEGEDSDKEQHSAEPEKEKEDKEEKNSVEEPEPATAADASVNVQSGLPAKPSQTQSNPTNFPVLLHSRMPSRISISSQCNPKTPFTSLLFISCQQSLRLFMSMGVTSMSACLYP